MPNATVAVPDVRANTELLLESIGIKRIVVVDDEYRAITVEDLIGLCSGLGAEKAHELPHLEGVAFVSDHDVWAKQLREKWPGLTEKEQSEVIAQARRFEADGSTDADNLQPDVPVAGAAADPVAAEAAMPGAGPIDEATTVVGDQPISAGDDSRAASSLEDLLHGLTKCDFVPLSLAQWRARSTEFLEGADAGATLFLFDRDFRKELQSQNEGFELVRAVQSKAVGYCGLITHTVSIGGEYEAWSTLAEQHNLDKDRFVVIAKQRLTGTPPDHYSFLRMVRLAALSGRCAIVKTAAWEIFEKSVEEAKAAMERLSVLDFDQIVLASPRREGVWEPDTLFRVFSILMRREARLLLRGDDAAMGSKVTDARRVSAVPLEAEVALGAEPPCLEAIKIQQFEMYESSEFLNRHYLPIDAGDIFEGCGGRRYILLAQPCDLMVRPNGRRSYDDKSGRSSTLVELLVGRKKSDAKASWAEVPFYEETSGRSGFVDFAKAHQVRLAVLDLCALNQDGTAVIDIEAACPDFAIESWKKRHGDLKKLYAAAMIKYNALASKQVNEVLKQLGLPIACTTVGFNAQVQGKVIRYDLRRVARLNQPRSGALLTAFAYYQSRAAFEHDFDDREPVAADADDPECDAGPGQNGA